VEFVEIYNASQKVIDLKEVRFTREDLTTHILDPAVSLTSTTYLMLPGDYWFYRMTRPSLKASTIRKIPDAFLNMPLPDLLTSEDILVLLNPSSQELDRLHYY
jgi:hypothetical protein